MGSDFGSLTMQKSFCSVKEQEGEWEKWEANSLRVEMPPIAELLAREMKETKRKKYWRKRQLFAL